MLDGVHRGQVGRVIAAGGGMVWIKIADVAELVCLATSSIEAASTRAPQSQPTGGSDPQP